MVRYNYLAVAPGGASTDRNNRNQYHAQSSYFSQYLQLAISLAVDLRLDRKPMRSKPSNVGSKRDPIALTRGPTTWGPEEQRASAGICYLSSK